LNPDADETEFTFELAQGTKKITIGYVRTDDKLFDACGVQKLFTDLAVISDDFTTVTLRSNSVGIPKQTNFEIIQ
jgi:hypothetical protein